ncbi:MAG TPA: hypothetical protein VNG53_00170 [Bacteroidia bacterium]|nr:hypothetical protein [Bacteroidia bacterium]
MSKRHLPIDSLTLDSSVMSPYEHGGKVNFTYSPKLEIYSPPPIIKLIPLLFRVLLIHETWFQKVSFVQPLI